MGDMSIHIMWNEQRTHLDWTGALQRPSGHDGRGGRWVTARGCVIARATVHFARSGGWDGEFPQELRTTLVDIYGKSGTDVPMGT